MNSVRGKPLYRSVIAAVIVFAVFLPQLAGHATSQESNRMIKVGVPVQSESKVGSKRFYVAKVLIDATPKEVWARLVDYEHLSECYPNLKECEVLSTDGNTKKVWFSINTVGGLWKFDYVLEITECEAQHLINWRRERGAFKVNDGSWKLEPSCNGTQTVVTYSKCIEGGLLMPKALVNHELKKSMPLVLQNLIDAIKKHKELAQKNGLESK